MPGNSKNFRILSFLKIFTNVRPPRTKFLTPSLYTRDPFFCIPQRITFTAIVVSITNDVHLTLMEGNLHWFINKLVRAYFQFVRIILSLVPDVRHSNSWHFSFGKSADDVNNNKTQWKYCDIDISQSRKSYSWNYPEPIWIWI